MLGNMLLSSALMPRLSVCVAGLSAGSDHSVQSEVFEKRGGAAVLHAAVDVCPGDAKLPDVPEVSVEECLQELCGPEGKDSGNCELT